MSKLDEVIKDMNKKSKEDLVSVGIPTYQHRRIPFTSPRMNYCTFGGIPMGKITELYGEEHGGKTTTALDLIANYQQMEDARKVLYVDAENTLDVEWAKKLGVDVDEMIVFHTLNKENIHDIAQIMIKGFVTRVKNQLDMELHVADSITDFVAEKGFDKDYGARPIRRTLQTEVEDVIAEAVLAGEIHLGDEVEVFMNEKKVCVQKFTKNI